jgi:hypothetical protein
MKTTTKKKSVLGDVLLGVVSGLVGGVSIIAALILIGRSS